MNKACRGRAAPGGATEHRSTQKARGSIENETACFDYFKKRAAYGFTRTHRLKAQYLSETGESTPAIASWYHAPNAHESRRARPSQARTFRGGIRSHRSGRARSTSLPSSGGRAATRRRGDAATRRCAVRGACRAPRSLALIANWDGFRSRRRRRRAHRRRRRRPAVEG